MTTNSIVPAANADITATLRALGMQEPPSQSDFFRAKVNGSTFELEELAFPSNQKSGAPAFIGRLVEMPLEYHGVYLTADEADVIGRPSIADKYCKSRYDKTKFPNEGGEYAQDGTHCRSCPINPYIKRDDSPLDGGKKCQWRGDVAFVLTDGDGNQLDGRVWTLSLSLTGMIEYKGLKKEPVKGHVSPENFLHQLARLGIAMYPDDDQQTAIGKAALALTLGGVVAEFRIVQAKSADGSRSYPVVSMKPITLIEGAQPHSALPSSTGVKNVTPTDEDELPF